MLSDIDFSALTHPSAPPARTNPTAHAVSSLASANGWQYFTHAVGQQLPGVVFRETDGKPRFSQRAVNIVRIPGDPSIEIGDSFYTEIAVGNQFTQQWGYVAVDLGVIVPSVTVEAESIHARSALPATPAGAVVDESRQGMRVEAAPGSEQAVAALLTPAIVGALGHPTYPLDAELSGQWLFLYAPRSLANDDAASWEHVLRTTELFVARVREVYPAGSPMPATTTAPPVDRSAVAEAPVSSIPASTPSAASVPSSPAPMQPRGSRVNGRRVALYLGVVFAVMIVGGVAALVFGH
ncbi:MULTISPECIES: hypothetical protein [unclassified Microbacterium]|uniref:hypothetical protein n=1 Tax=unclassified Microbacterium TaxID=2609290 RepID=UPI000976D8F7|nr:MULTISPECIES: hypothetical protein [unclassified Microbacterium]